MSTVELIHYWTTLGAFTVLMAGLIALGIGVAHPATDRRGDRWVSGGVVTLIGVTAVYLIYAATAITYVTVVRP